MDDLLPVKDLSYEKWKVKVLSKVDNELVKACLVCIERMRVGEELSQTEKEYVKCAINSFSVLGRPKKALLFVSRNSLIQKTYIGRVNPYTAIDKLKITVNRKTEPLDLHRLQ